MTRQIKDLVKELFGDQELTSVQLWALVKMLKIARLRCRNNTALNNQLNSAFPYATFRQVQKERPCAPKFPGGPTTEFYEGLQITVKGAVAQTDDDGE